MKRVFVIFFIVLAVFFIIQSCTTYFFRSNYKEANTLMHETGNLQTKPFLKAHLKNGDVCILKDSWQIDTSRQLVSGSGIRYDFNRQQTFQGIVIIPIDSVAIFETNTKIDPNPETQRIRALTVLAGVDVAVGIYCITNPKACYGSCPTFYLDETDNFHYADAEGFSSAISPSMEYHDIDALDNVMLKEKEFAITMKNEALETHCVDDVKILAYPLLPGERVYQSPSNGFYLCDNSFPLTRAQGPEGDVTSLLLEGDRKERFSSADENDLNTKEELFMEFDDVHHNGNLGLRLNFRQTLMTTYFIYSAMGYMGDEVSDIFSKIETSSDINNKLKGGIKQKLGNIDVYLWNEKTKEWELQGGFNETGPIAINRQFLPVKSRPSDSRIRIKLVLNKGFWRIDHASLTAIRKQVSPMELYPSAILYKGSPDPAALRDINSSGGHLVSMPGSEYKFIFKMPASDTEYDLFLYSKGYYLEWMRTSWLKEKNLLKLYQMVEDPESYLKEEAKSFKEYEKTMEQEFWNSRIDTKIFSYHGNK